MLNEFNKFESVVLWVAGYEGQLLGVARFVVAVLSVVCVNPNAQTQTKQNVPGGRPEEAIVR